MVEIIEYISYALMPLLIVLVIGFGLKNKVSIYEAFIEGSKESFSVIFEIFPSMLAILLAINLLKTSRWNGAFRKSRFANIFSV